jgi:hypothetical protein
MGGAAGFAALAMLNIERYASASVSAASCDVDVIHCYGAGTGPANLRVFMQVYWPSRGLASPELGSVAPEKAEPVVPSVDACRRKVVRFQGEGQGAGQWSEAG